ncbi:hypothetical protein OROHE_017429 [Orobanche hederae]
MKIQLAVRSGLAEKQVSEWFCQTKLKDENRVNDVSLRQDRSSGVIQDHVSGHMQDFCGSIRPVDKRIYEVESERVTLDECYRTDDASSGSNSSLWNMSKSNHHRGSLVTKFPRSGPSGYLKVKSQVENTAINVVKRQLGKHHREDGPPLGVEFDPLPPGAFEPSMQNPGDGETCYIGDTVLPASPEFSKIQQLHKFGKRCEYDSSMDSRTSFKMPQGSDIPDNYFQQKYKQNTTATSFANDGAYYYPPRDSFAEFPEISPREISGRDDCGVRYMKGAEVMRTSSFLNSTRHLQPFGGKLRENIENGSTDSTMKDFGYYGSFDQMQQQQPRRTAKDLGKTCANENQFRIPYKNDRTDLKRMRDGFSHQLHLKKPSPSDNQLRTYQIPRFGL